MKKQNLFLLIIFLLPMIAFSQVDPNKIFEPKFTHEIEAELETGKLRKGRASTYYSNIDEYEKSLINLDIPIIWQLDTMSKENLKAFSKFQPINAINYLSKRTENEQIVIISEAHQKPQHRIFTTKMLKSLYANGFRHLGIETLSPDFTERISRDKDRDLQQALNIERYLKLHPNEKIVIHCGWYHAIESNFPKAIYQDALSEKINLPESPYYKMIKAKEISVLVNENGDLFNGVDTVNHFDVLVYHPRTEYIKNRPNWLLKVKGNRLVKVKRNKVSKSNYPVIVKAILEKEGKEAVPVDVIELKSKKDVKRLVLPKGKYLIELIDKNRKVTQYTKSVK